MKIGEYVRKYNEKYICLYKVEELLEKKNENSY